MSSPHDDEHLHLVQNDEEQEDLVITGVLLGALSGFIMGIALMSMIWWLS